MDICFPCAAMGFFERSNGFGKKDDSTTDHSISGAGGTMWRKKRNEGFLMYPCQIQSCEPDPDGLLPQITRSVQIGACTLLKKISKSSEIISRKCWEFSFHVDLRIP